MAANNYYGYGGTGAYGAQYPTATNTYAGQQQYSTVAPGTTPTAPSAGAAYQTDQSSYVIGGYARPVGQVTAATQQQQQAYYSQQQQQQQGYQMTAAKQIGAIGTRPPAPTPSTVYPSYAANTTGQTSYSGFTQTNAQTAVAGAKSSFTNYDAAVYNAVTAYAQGSTGGVGRGGGGLGFRGRGGGNPMNKMKGQRPMPKPQTLHYCDVCKISCAGPQTYKEHLEGQKHKKKETLMKAGTPPVAKGSPAGLRCELCDVTCTGSDAYAAHIRGAKHQKVFKLHTKLGKPIPSDSPTVVQPPGGPTPTIGPQSTPQVSQPKVNAGPFVKPAPPKINFIGPKTDLPFDRFATGASTSGESNATVESSPLATSYSTLGTVTPVSSSPVTPMQTSSSMTSSSPEDKNGGVEGYSEKEIQPVGQDYIEEIRTDDGKGISFNCKLCECRFNDPNAKEMHMKGRRHRLQYKKKVNPDLIVDVKPSSRQKKIEDRRSVRGGSGRRGPMSPDSFPRGPPVPLLQPSGSRGFVPGFGQPNPMYYIPPLIRRMETNEDRHVMAKHAEIYPKEEELQAIQRIVSNTEKALKFVSDEIAEADAKKANGVAPTKTESEEVKESDAAADAAKLEAELQMHRILKGVMRVGNLAKGLLLRDDRSVQLVVLCSIKPTVTLLHQITTALPKQLKIVAPDEDYNITTAPEEAALRILSIQEPKIEVIVTLTSPTLRIPPTPAEGEATATTETEPGDLLDKEKCLDALAALRHAKWFQARATALQSCVIVIRILRDLCQRVSAWSSLQPWAVELITEKAVSSAGMPISPGEALRLVFEVISSGVILASGPGLLDPCEKESVDALAAMPLQGREDVTAYAQQALRQIQFRQIHKILGIEQIPRFQKKSGFGSRKRRRNNSSGGDADETDPASDGKKDKKESGDETMEAEVDTDPADATPAIKEEPK